MIVRRRRVVPVLLLAPALVAVTVVTYLLSAIGVGRIAAREDLPPREERRPLRAEIAEGLRFVVHQPLLRRIVATTSISNFGSAVTAAPPWLLATAVLTRKASPAGVPSAA